MRNLAIFGAGAQGRTAAALYIRDKRKIVCFIDNDSQKQGTTVLGINVISFDDYIKKGIDADIIITAPVRVHQEISDQIRAQGLQNYSIFNSQMLLRNERFLSYSYPTENEDVILNHVFKGEKDIFWIDIGSNDPVIGSVTKAFYDRGHCGINVDMEKGLIDISKKERIRDINIWAGVGKEIGKAYFYSQGDWCGLSTMVEANIYSENAARYEVDMTTLKAICDRYVKSRSITFLKVDVEGKEKDVLLGADFKKYRPKLVIIEATLPCTDIPNYEEWEHLVVDAGYHFVYEHGVNRYYVADECAELDEKFIPWTELAALYCIFHADILHCC